MTRDTEIYDFIQGLSATEQRHHFAFQVNADFSMQMYMHDESSRPFTTAVAGMDLIRISSLDLTDSVVRIMVAKALACVISEAEEYTYVQNKVDCPQAATRIDFRCQQAERSQVEEGARRRHSTPRARFVISVISHYLHGISQYSI